MSFRSELHPRGFGGKFVSAGEHAFKADAHQRKAKAALTKARRPAGKGNTLDATIKNAKLASKHLALSRLHTHAAKRINSGRSGRLGSTNRGGPGVFVNSSGKSILHSTKTKRVVSDMGVAKHVDKSPAQQFRDATNPKSKFAIPKKPGESQAAFIKRVRHILANPQGFTSAPRRGAVKVPNTAHHGVRIK